MITVISLLKTHLLVLEEHLALAYGPLLLLEHTLRGQLCAKVRHVARVKGHALVPKLKVLEVLANWITNLPYEGNKE